MLSNELRITKAILKTAFQLIENINQTNKQTNKKNLKHLYYTRVISVSYQTGADKSDKTDWTNENQIKYGERCPRWWKRIWLRWQDGTTLGALQNSTIKNEKC